MRRWFSQRFFHFYRVTKRKLFLVKGEFIKIFKEYSQPEGSTHYECLGKCNEMSSNHDLSDEVIM